MTNGGRVATGLGITALALASAAVAATTAGAQVPARSASIQQAFDTATALNDAQDYAAALAAWEALEPRVASNRRTRALVRLRKASALLGLNRFDEAAASVQAGIVDLPANDPSLAADRFLAYYLIGGTEAAALDYASAGQSYAQARQATTDPGARLNALIAEAGVEIFVDPAVAKRALDEADALAATLTISRELRAILLTQRSVLLLNQGAFADARKVAGQAVDVLGGLKSMTGQRDVAARSDAAIAALLAGHDEDARRYMAYTGAGRLPKQGFDPAKEMRLPDCGGDAGLKPVDVAIVEFSIGDDGRVIQVAPVYAAGGPDVALSFARAANDWVWDQDAVKATPRFYRTHVRVEVRCSTAFERPSVTNLFEQKSRAWLESHGASVPDIADDPRRLVAARAALATAEARDPASLQTAAAMAPLLASRLVGREETQRLAERSRTILVAHQAPASVLLPVDAALDSTARAQRRRSPSYGAGLTKLLSDPAYQADPEASAGVRLLLADADPRAARPATEASLKTIVDDPTLKADNALRIGALVRLASIAQNRGDAASARAAYEKTGLTAAQCAIVDSQPKPLSLGGTFPIEAQRWGFEGWSVVQHDITAAGRVRAERVVLSYPPFIFSNAAATNIAGVRYARSYRPDGDLGCGAAEQRIKFVLPH